MKHEIHVCAVLISDKNGRVLHVRKHGTQMFMLPGGKPESDEHPKDTASREFLEELGLALDQGQLTDLGTFHAPAANEAGFTVVAHVFTHPYISGVKPAAEIEALEWISPRTSRTDIAPLNTEHLFPALLSGVIRSQP